MVDKNLNTLAERQEIRGSDEYARTWANFELMVLAPVLAQEVMRLCDGIELIRDRCETLSETAKEHGLHQLAHEMDINARALAGVLKGSC